MIAAVGYKDKTIAVMGLGRTGLSAAKSLILGGAKVVAWDDNEDNCEAAATAGIECQDLCKRDWSDIAALILSPGIAHTHPKPHHVAELARAVNMPILGDTELFAQAINAIPKEDRPIVFGITGTNGKSTTTMLLTHILRECGHDAHAGGNIGRACLDLPAPQKGMIYVLELSSYQLELTQSLHCNGAILLNISPDHLDRHGGFEGYVAAKRRIFARQTKDDVAIISMDDPTSPGLCMHYKAQNAVQVVPISAQGMLSRGISAVAGKLYESDGHATHVRADISAAPALKGTHNGQNAAAAFAAARHVGVSAEGIATAMQNFAGLDHRMEMVGTLDGVVFINDSKATNADAVRQALGAYGNVYWIAGGQAKSGGLGDLAGAFDTVEAAFLIGEAQEVFAKQLKGKVKASLCDTLEVAVARAYEAARQSDAPSPVVLLSPACASFDQFTDFMARGAAFRAAFAGLEGAEQQKRPA
ncbi:MAG: UDP-N-acetylmuramoyl-L-alanine--D-glutamate ligase [Robiginitomaculum sp.]|nr:MAG: UDP-N-acetylmuramoyl-L-alanine--D-glutamate ligase [Robiginitomaculum sp.]